MVKWSNCQMRLFLDDCEDVALTHHQILFTFELQLCATVLAIQHLVASLQNHLFVLGAITRGLLMV